MLACRVVAAVAVACSLVSVSAAGGQTSEPVTTTTIIIAKHIVGPDAGASTVRMECQVFVPPDNTPAGTIPFDFRFDASGQPTTNTLFLSGIVVSKIDGAWRIAITPPADPPSARIPTNNCTFTETEPGGASATTWSCDYSNSPTPDPPTETTQLGCTAAAGMGTGPVAALLGFIPVGVAAQTVTVGFTNTFVAASPPPVQGTDAKNVVPAFTG